MSEAMMNILIEQCESVAEHHDMVEERIRLAGMEPDPRIVVSIAKYWSALERLAAE